MTDTQTITEEELDELTEWPAYIDWMTKNVIAYRKSFQGRIKKWICDSSA